jgi:hypothetical protein
MSFFNIYNKAKKHINKTYFSEKNVISFEAYNLLKKYIVNGVAEPDVLDKAYPKNLRMKVLKNVSQRSMKTFYKLSDRYPKNKSGVLFQSNNYPIEKKKISSKAKNLLNKIKKDLPRYTEIDSLIKKYKSD